MHLSGMARDCGIFERHIHVGVIRGDRRRIREVREMIIIVRRTGSWK